MQSSRRLATPGTAAARPPPATTAKPSRGGDGLAACLAKSVSQCDAFSFPLKLRNESGTNRGRIADSIPGLKRSPQHLGCSPGGGTRSSLNGLHKHRICGLNSLSSRAARVESEAGKSQLDSGDVRCRSGSSGCDESYCVFATRGGAAVVTNDVASSMAWPSGVGIVMRNGTKRRVPAIGTKAISMLRWAARYLITGRSGM